ncbi:MAG: PSD1 and planctomycete cytochrome C domain-containing protein [Chthoniobacteraceae bacterium]
MKSVLRSCLAALAFARCIALGGTGEEFFEMKVRPLLVERCYECHSTGKKTKGGLALDSRAGWQKGGDTGPALVPGKPDDSLLIKAVSYGDPDLSMPPKKKLSDAEVATLVEWVKMGAPDPREAATVKAAIVSMEKRREHWAYQPIANPPAPAVRDAAWPRNDIDRFTLARLEANAQRPNPPASDRTLIRRAHFDLLGLPPTFEEAEGRLDIDALLARPEYGQRWARHWLDVARYADTIEQSVDGERRIPFAHTYRDYVIDALNSDKPFDRFIVEQIAADRMESADLRALGFLTVGRRFRANAEEPHLVLDDRIDTISRGFLATTLACARCHDHKFDPVPTADYYSLAGILGSVVEPLDLPETRRIGDEAAVTKYLDARSKLLAEYEAHIDECVKTSHAHFRDFATEYLQHHVRSSANHRTTAGYVPLDTPRGLLVYEAPARWSALLAQCRDEPFFQLWHQFMALRKESFTAGVGPILAAMDEYPQAHHPLVVAAFREKTPTTMLDAATIYGGIIQAALKSDSTDARSVVDLVFGPGSPVPPHSRDEVQEDIHRFLNEKSLVNRRDGEKGNKLRDRLAALEATAPVERARVVRASAQPLDAHILIRGEMKQPGPAVPRRFLTMLASVDDRTYADDGRLQLAQAIASPKNPLTARVIVNRVWQHHFGEGLVATPDDFGAMGAKPSNPELLDHLASWFIAHGWSLKALHRYILDSSTWRQSGPPRRLEFEPLRDSLLAVAGRLDARAGGASTPLDVKNVRRAIYGYTDRFRIPALMRNFDVANPDTSISRRAETLVPLQALYLLNSPFVRQQAEALALRAKEDVAQLFRLALSREPTAGELALARDFLHDSRDPRAWANFAQSLLLSNEFTYVD